MSQGHHHSNGKPGLGHCWCTVRRRHSRRMRWSDPLRSSSKLVLSRLPHTTDHSQYPTFVVPRSSSICHFGTQRGTFRGRLTVSLLTFQISASTYLPRWQTWTAHSGLTSTFSNIERGGLSFSTSAHTGVVSPLTASLNLNFFTDWLGSRLNILWRHQRWASAHTHTNYGPTTTGRHSR